MKYEILGPLRVVDDNRISIIGARKIESLLTVLLIRSDHVLTTDQLMSEIWGEQLPRRASAGIYVYISELRKFLNRPGRPESPIITRSPGYMLHMGSDEFDFPLFMRLMKLGREYAREQRHEEASESFEHGLAMWRGPVLGGDHGSGPIINGFVTFATEARMECTEMLMESELQLGHHRVLVGRLHSLITENPLREGFYRQLMLSLYRSDHKADALRVYQSARKILSEELGLEPCRALQNIQRAILMADDKFLGAYATV